ncbi:unnamed protein product [Trifolium pratense]|uniref:Uncharacterized protein n=1 Tax=Trifolium pratense TaxID=57577 RepID=A0ACB0L019_TRIPR|nr:unnamed protein product [Trifolium pratense]
MMLKILGAAICSILVSNNISSMFQIDKRAIKAAVALRICSRWGHGDPYCDHCVGIQETMLHVMRDCSGAYDIWKHLVPLRGRLELFTCYYHDWVVSNLKATVTVADSVEWKVVWATTCDYLWRWRNTLTFDANFVIPLHTHTEIMKYVGYYYKAKPTSDVAL